MTDTPETRDSLLLRLRDGEDRQAWETFAAIYRPLVVRVAMRRGMQAADAEDLARKVLLGVADAVAGFRPDGRSARFRTWLIQVVRNAIVDHWRRLRPDAPHGGSEAANWGAIIAREVAITVGAGILTGGASTVVRCGMSTVRAQRIAQEARVVGVATRPAWSPIPPTAPERPPTTPTRPAKAGTTCCSKAA